MDWVLTSASSGFIWLHVDRTDSCKQKPFMSKKKSSLNFFNSLIFVDEYYFFKCFFPKGKKF